jgi:hypothetical protein
MGYGEILAERSQGSAWVPGGGGGRAVPWLLDWRHASEGTPQNVTQLAQMCQFFVPGLSGESRETDLPLTGSESSPDGALA